MKKLTPAASGGPAAAAEDDGTSRRQFLAGAGTAAGAAMIVASPKVASVLDTPGGGAAAEPKPVVTQALGRRAARTRDGLRAQRGARRGHGDGRHARDHIQRSGARKAAARRGQVTRADQGKEASFTCHRTARRRRSAQTPSPTTPTPTHLSVPTTPR